MNSQLSLLPTEGLPNMHHVAVLVQQTPINKFKVYIGGANMPEYHPDHDDVWQKYKERACEYVAAHGNAITYKKALSFFPHLPEEEYAS